MNLRFHLDTEFSGHGGWLLSLALVVDREDYLYLVLPEEEIERTSCRQALDPWVDENVIPILYDVPEDVEVTIAPMKDWGILISQFLCERDYDKNQHPQIVADWPEDFRYLMELLITGPGTAVPMLDQTHFTIIRHVDIYPTALKGAVQHNAWWDALAIREYLLT